MDNEIGGNNNDQSDDTVPETRSSFSCFFSITTGKNATLLARRRLLQLLHDPRAVAKTLEVLGPRFQDRRGGYTRITRIGRRQGDGSSMVILEILQ